MKHLFLKVTSISAICLTLLLSCQEKKDYTLSKNQQWNQEDYKAVKGAILDYVEALYQVDSTRIDRSVDVNLRKIGYYFGPDKVWKDNLPMTHQQLSSLAARWNKKGDRVNNSTPKKIEIYDINSKTASAKLTAAWGIDYFHLGKYNNQWKIINVMWQSMPKEKNE